MSNSQLGLQIHLFDSHYGVSLGRYDDTRG